MEDHSQVGVARRFASGLADLLEFSEEKKGRLTIVVTELCTNLLNHAGGGEILLRPFTWNSNSGIEVLAIDRGPGMRDLAQCMTDGYSTTSTPGNGLGAINRLSDVFDIFTRENQGTVVLSIMFNRPNYKPSPEELCFGIIMIPVKGEQECGDAWSFRLTPSNFNVVVADGLGHGLLAHQASSEVLKIFSEAQALPLEVQMTQMHEALRKLRGAAVSMVDIEFSRSTLDFIGVGNVRCAVVEQNKMRTLVCQSGTAGLQIRNAKVFSSPWSSQSLIILHSDGITTRWDLNTYLGLAVRHPAVIAAILYRDFNRNNDDVTVFIGAFP
jgi:anti-sigma regulatory factor (Ser/Thr protein kinase)